MRSYRIVLAALIVVLTSSAAMAQHGGMRVIVYDAADKTPFPGVSVTLKNSMQLVATTTQTTDANGVAEFPVLRVGGGYIVEVFLTGYAKQQLTNQRVEFNKVTTLTFVLSPEMTEKVVVKGTRETVDLEKTSTSTKFGDDFIQDLPVQGRLYQNVLSLTAGVQDADGDGNPNVMGARDRDFKTQVGGVSNQDPLTGQWMNLVNADSIEEVEVITAGAGVEFGRAQGGFANIIQKQGSNEFEGVFNLLFRSAKLDGSASVGRPGARAPDYQTWQPAIQVSGPIVKDKLWYRLSHELIRREDPLDLVNQTAVVTTNRSINADQITWQVSPRNKLAFQLQWDPLKISNLGISSLSPPETSFTQEAGGPQYSLTWTAPYSSKILVDSIVAYQDSKLDIYPGTEGVPNNCIGVGELPALNSAQCTNLSTGQTSGSYYMNWNDNRQRLTVKSQATIYGGRFWGMNHQFKVGLSVENEKYVRDLERRPNVAFFRVQGPSDQAETGKDDLQETIFIFGTFATPQMSRANASGTSWGIFFEDQVKPLQNLTITLGLRLDRETTTSGGFVPLKVQAESDYFLERVRQLQEQFPGQDPRQYAQAAVQESFTAYEGSLDEFIFQLAPQLGLSPQDVRRNLTPTSIQSFFWNKTRQPDNVNLVNTNFSPRLSVAWDPWSNGKTKFSLTAGRYFDKIFLAVPLIELEPSFATIVFTGKKDLKQGGSYTPTLDRGINPTINTQVVDRNLKTPYQDELTFSVERELWAETSLKATFVYRKFKNQLQDVDLNHYPYDYGRCSYTSNPKAPPLVSPPDGVLDDCIGEYEVPKKEDGGTGGNSPVDLSGLIQRPDGFQDTYGYNPGWGGVYEVSNLNTAEFTGVVLELVRRQYRNWQMEASYTWSRAIGDAEDFASFLGDDRTTRDNEYGYLSYDQRNVLKVNATTITPWGFRLGSTVQWQTGLPYSILDQTVSLDAAAPQYTGLAAPEARTRIRYPTRQRNDQRNRAYWTFDVRLDKELNLAKGLNMQLALDIYNLFNERVYMIYSPFGGYGAQINGFNQAFVTTGRTFQVGFKMSF